MALKPSLSLSLNLTNAKICRPKVLLLFILLATAHNFADDNTLTCFGKTIQKLIGSLGPECDVALNWFNENKMIVNPEKLQAIVMDKRKQDHTNEIFKTGFKIPREKRCISSKTAWDRNR